jgi:DNA polymerase-3 subunit delta
MTTTIFIFHGDDDITLGEAVNRLRAEMGDDSNADLNISEIDGTITSVAEIINTVASFPFLSDKRLVIVRDLISSITGRGAGQSGKDAIARLQAELPNLPETARLVLVERETLRDNNPVLKLAQTLDNTYVRAFETPKDMVRWILSRAKQEYETEMDHRAAAALAAVTGNDVRLADNELVKLVNYVADDERAITEDDVATLTPYVPEANIFKMVDAIAEGRGQLALELMHRLMADKKQDAFSIYGMIVRQFRLLLIAKEYAITGGQGNTLAQVAGVAGFVAQSLSRQARGFSMNDLERIYQNLAETDEKMKTGRIQPELALDLFIVSIAR